MKSRVHLVAGLVAAVTAGMLVPAATSSPTAAQDQTQPPATTTTTTQSVNILRAGNLSNFQVTVSDSEISMSWSPPPNGGSERGNGYHVSLYLDGTDLFRRWYAPEVTNLTFQNLQPSTTYGIYINNIDRANPGGESTTIAIVTTTLGDISSLDPDRPQQIRAITPQGQGKSVEVSLSAQKTGECIDYSGDSGDPVFYPCRELDITLVGFPRDTRENSDGSTSYYFKGASFGCYRSDRPDTIGIHYAGGHFGYSSGKPGIFRVSNCGFDGPDGTYLTVFVDDVQSNSVRFSALDGSGVDRDAPVQVNQNGGTPPPPPPPPAAVPVDPSPTPSGRRAVELSSPRNLRVERADLGATGGAAHDYWIRWDPPSDDGGAQVVRYEGEVTTGYWIFKTTRPFRTNSSPFEFRGRTCTTYSVSVSATNSAGRVSAPATESADTFCPGAPPGEPRDVKLTVEEHFGNPWLVAQWTPPTEDGGQRVHSYRLEAWLGSGSRPSGSDPIRASTGRTSKRLVKNPEFGATYTVRIAARNRVGTGDWVYESVVARYCPAGGKYERKRDGGLFGSHRVYALTEFPLADNSMVEKGDKGGIVTSGNLNLSQSGCSWISGDDKTQVVDAAIVEDNALVTGGARVQEHAIVSGDAIVNGGDIKIEEHASVSGNARITSKALISDEAKISGNAKVGSGDGGITRVYGKAKISDDAVVSGNARVYGEDSKVYDNAKVSGNARVYGEASVFGNAHVTGNAHVYGSAQVTGRTSCMNNGRLQARLTCWTNDTKLKPAEVTGYAHVYGDAEVSGSARILGNARVSGEAEVTGNALIFGDMEIDSGVYDGTQEHKRAAEELYDMTYNKVREELIEACPNTISRENLHSLTMSLMARGPAPGSLDESTLLGCSQNRVISDMLDALSVSGWELFLEFGLPVVKASSIKRLALIADVLELGLSIRDAVDTRAALDEATKRFSEWGISEQDFKAVNEKVFKEYNALIAKRR